MKRNLIMADVHSNITALKAVLNSVQLEDLANVICLGDVVGYGPAPNESIELLKDIDAQVIAGNHDAASCGLMDTTYFNRHARKAVEWTKNALTEDHHEYLRSLPEKLLDDQFAYYHGSPLEPLTEYITTERQAEKALSAVDGSKIAVGHTHQPAFYREDDTRMTTVPVRGEKSVDGIGPHERIVINPGSVGQPRDGDPRASYVIIEVEGDQPLKVEWNRVDYNIKKVQDEIRSADLPEILASRLQRGQ